jgi:diguanylate cyclase (GGDEF)-like protein/PAS domain S-box-containing protein
MSTAAPPGRQPVVALLAVLGAAAVVASALLSFRVLPAASRQSVDAIDELGEVEHAQALIRGQSNDERGYLLNGDPWFLDQSRDKEARVGQALERLKGVLDPDEQPLLDSIRASYQRFLDHHRRVVALVADGRREEAVALALADGRMERLETERLLEAVHEHVVADSTEDARTARRQAALLVGVLLVLGFVPGWGAFLLSRTYRRLRQDEEAALDRRRLAEAQRVARLGSWEHTVATGETVWSEQMFRLLGYEPGQIEPSVEAYLGTIHPEDRPRMMEVIEAGVAAGRHFSVRNRVIRPDGSLVWLDTQGELTLGPDGTLAFVVGTAVDVTEQEQAAEEIQRGQEQLVAQEAEMRRRAYHDSLTGLPNRALLFERLEEALVVAAYGGTARAAVAVLDLDGFKRINDSLGHVIGDRLLVGVAQRLSAAVEGSVMVARLGGDEFAVLVLDCDEGEALEVVQRLLGQFDDSFAIDGRQLTLSASVGLAVATSSSGAELLRDADVALYAAKDAGRARCVVFDPAMRAVVVDRLALENDLREAIEAGALDVHYQPIVDTATGAVVKAEALVRWAHPTRGQVFPDRFIPLAEETGLIVPLGMFVLRTACRTVVDLGELRVAVNLSARQLSEPDLVECVDRVLSETGLAPARLVLEVTESVLMAEDVVARGVLDSLRGLGVGLAIDDFGTGYSSLSRLRLLPVDELKIDKSFIDEVDTEGERAPVVAAVVALAHGLGLKVVAEGVETEAQLAALLRLHCDSIQGYLFSRAVPATALAELMGQPDPFAALASGDARPAASDGVQEAVVAVVREEHDVEARLRPLLGELARVTGMESAYLTRVDPAQGTHEVFLVHNAGELAIQEGTKGPWIDTLCRHALTSPRRSSADVTRDFPDSADVATLGLRAYAVAPVTTSSGRLVGTLCVASRAATPVDNRTVVLMDIFAGLIAETLEQLVPGTLGQSLRAMVVDDNPTVRHALAKVLADGGVEVVAEVGDGAGAVDACRAHRPDIVLLDLELGDVDGLELLPVLEEAAPGVKVVVVSASGAARRVEAMEAGVAAVVDKQTSIDRLPALLRML